MMEALLDEKGRTIKHLSFNSKDFDMYSAYAWMVINTVSQVLSQAELKALQGFFCMSQIMVKEAGFEEDKTFTFQDEEGEAKGDECNV